MRELTSGKADSGPATGSHRNEGSTIFRDDLQALTRRATFIRGSLEKGWPTLFVKSNTTYV